MNDREARDRIRNAISTSNYRWRTARGIAKDSGVPFPQTVEILERSGEFIQARKANNRGERLYSTSDKVTSTASLGQRILSALTNKIGE